ncbi:MAG: histidine kinase [Bacteroidales bacterium]|nr:histidine kinase [Bacteroidales bacterium]MDY0141136.1 histidine kinase [Bacteroidales bacterium]
MNHLMFWLAYILFSGIVFYFGNSLTDDHSYFSALIIDFVSIYVILLVLIPKFVQKKYQLTKFFVLLILLILLNLTINFFLQNFIFANGELAFDTCLHRQIHSIQVSLVFIVIAIGIKIFMINQQNQLQMHKLEQAKTVSELDFLKTQMNPHFLFNILNNIYIQTRIDPKKSSEMILKLSDLLRYQLYECSQDKVMLKAEVEYLRNYVDLQKMRIAKIDIKFEQNGSFKGLMIYPFMFIPFLENAFKHGVSSKNVDNFIHIYAEIVEKYVIFAVKNSKNDTRPITEIKQGGIGLINIKRRLELLYKDNHELIIEDRDTYYYVKLKIELK